MNLPLHFRWPFCNDGYEVVEGLPIGGGAVGEYIVPVSSKLTQRIFPSPQLQVFLFQRPHFDHEHVLFVAGQLGLLGTGQVIQCVVDGRLTERRGELLTDWQNLAFELNYVLLTWRMSCVASWEEWDSFFYQARQQPPSRPGSSDDLAELKQGSAELAASRAAERLGYCLAIRVMPNAEPSLRFCPQTLRDYLWLEVALGIASGGRPTACQSCGHWYLTSSGHSRSDKLYCSDACRMRAYRARHKAA